MNCGIEVRNTVWELWIKIGPQSLVAWLPLLTAAVALIFVIGFLVYYLAGLGTRRPMLKCAALAALIHLAAILLMVQLPKAAASPANHKAEYAVEIQIPGDDNGESPNSDLQPDLSTSMPLEPTAQQPSDAPPAPRADPRQIEAPEAPSLTPTEVKPEMTSDPNLVLPPTPQLAADAPAPLQPTTEAPAVDLSESLGPASSELQSAPTMPPNEVSLSQAVEPLIEPEADLIAPIVETELPDADQPTIEVAPLSPPSPPQAAPRSSAELSPEAALTARPAPVARPSRVVPSPIAPSPSIADVPPLPRLDEPIVALPPTREPSVRPLPDNPPVAAAPPKASSDQDEPAPRFDLNESLSPSSIGNSSEESLDKPNADPMKNEPTDEIAALLARAIPAEAAVAPSLDEPRFWQNRTAPDRLRIVFEHGGSEETERAVAMALAWLAVHQSDDGRWDSDGFDARCPVGDKCTGPAIENTSDSGLTGLALLAFLGAGHTHMKASDHQETVRRGLSWLMRAQRVDGDLQFGGRIYAHSMATLALTEAFAMTGDERLREPAQRAVRWLAEAQHVESGSWRYAPRQFGDTSVYGWAVLALRSARSAGLDVPVNTWRLAQKWLPMVSLGARGGLASYRPGYPASHAMTAEALFCRQVFDAVDDSALVSEASDFVLARLPDPSDHHIYYWYYGTLAMFQLGGERWERWNNRLTATLLSTQNLSGHAAGSWDPHRPFGVDGGRIFSTSASALCLEVYYRYLPLYSASAP